MARALVLRRRGLRVMLRGPSWASDVEADDRPRLLRRIARQTGATVILPERPLSGFGLIPLMTSRHVALWSLDSDIDTLKGRLWGKWRNRMTSAARLGLDVRTAGPAALELLIAAEAVQRRTRHYRALPPDFTRCLPAESLRLWQWHEGAHLHATMCFVRHGSWATYHMGYADPRARELGAHSLILWQAALALRSEGVRVLDLGDVNSEETPGLARFKLGTGAALHRLGETCLVLPG